MTDKAHSQVNEGSRHAIHNLTYPNAANRIAGTNEGKGHNPPASTNIWQIAKQDDDDSIWMCVDTAPLTWTQIMTATSGDLDVGYGAFGATPSTITIDAAEGQTGSLLWDLSGTGIDNRFFDIGLANGTDETGGDGVTYHTGFRVLNGLDSLRVVRSAADAIDLLGTLSEVTVQASTKIELSSISTTFELLTNLPSGDFLCINTNSTALTGSSGAQSFVDIAPSITQTGTAGYNGLLIDVDINSVGSGEQNLLNLQLGGVDRFRVDSTGNTRIGTGAPGVATGVGDLYVTGKLEVDGLVTADAGLYSAGHIGLSTSSILRANAYPTQVGSIGFSNSSQISGITSFLYTGATANSWIMAEIGDVAFDFAHGAQTNPTLIGHSANRSTTEWWSLTHNQTDAVLSSGAGALSLAPASGVVAMPDTGQILYDTLPASDLTAAAPVTTSATVDANATGISAALYQAADGNWDEADADALATMPCRALALETGTGTKLILRRGWIRNDAWAWTPGGPVYAGTTTGALTQTKPSGTGDQVQIVGYAETADILDFNPSTVIVEVA